MANMLSKPLALITTTTVSVLSLLAAAAASISLSTRPGLRKARLALHLGFYRLNINYLTARSFYYLCSPLVGVKIEVEGREYLDEVLAKAKRGEKGGSAVLVGNHQSFMDILYLGRIFPKRASIMAKRELKWMPLLGWFMSLSGAVFVDRKNNKDAVKAMNAAGEAMKRQGVSLWIFPEGTRSSKPEPGLLPFKKGAFHLAIQVLPPISTEGMTAADVHSLADEVREKMLDTLREISTPSPEATRNTTDGSDRAEGESEPLLGRPSGTYADFSPTMEESNHVRRRSSKTDQELSSGTTSTGRSSSRSPSSSSIAKEAATTTTDTLAETGKIDGRQLVNDVKDTAKKTVTTTSGGEEEEDELDEHGAVFVNKPN
ncbi:hypothetical protein QFC22_006727 [Naganishia vaughanmartiniae]|uniref:Uncharacterized protein n=1 Tax=Naganishia vaughanmartiniae TaxID=1424756 RepID=A0ACC2WHE7_9TREE|nr:hypothetical protein QFC22_006727 [Naganishia vaughanmartiniae]